MAAREFPGVDVADRMKISRRGLGGLYLLLIGGTLLFGVRDRKFDFPATGATPIDPELVRTADAYIDMLALKGAPLQRLRPGRLMISHGGWKRLSSIEKMGLANAVGVSAFGTVPRVFPKGTFAVIENEAAVVLAIATRDGVSYPPA